MRRGMKDVFQQQIRLKGENESEKFEIREFLQSVKM